MTCGMGNFDPPVNVKKIKFIIYEEITGKSETFVMIQPYL
jgi:hypothetical protein